MSNLFAHLAGRKTVAVNASRGGHIYGVFNPSIPSTSFESARYGVSDHTSPSQDHPFGEQLTTGFVYGPEGTGTIGGPNDVGAQGLQAAINHGALAGAPWLIPIAAQADADDWRDSLLIVGDQGDNSSVYGTVVKRDLDAWSTAHAPAQASVPALPSTSPSVPPTAPSAIAPTIDLSTILAQLTTLTNAYVTIRADLATIKSTGAGAIPITAPPVALPPTIAPPAIPPVSSSSVLDPSELADILNQAQAALGALTGAGMGVTGGGPWVVKLRKLALAIVLAEKS